MQKIKKPAIALIVLILLIASCSTKYENPADLPFGSNEWQKQTANEVISLLKEAGFTNIQENVKETSNKYDVGKITTVTVDGSHLFSKGDRHEGTDVVEITYYALKQFEPELIVEVTGDAGLPVFTINTNLPNKTKLVLTLENGDGYREQQTIKVKDGTASSDMFWDNGYYLIGEYTLTVVMKPEDQDTSVMTSIGGKGETLTGALVKTDDNIDKKYLYAEETYISNYTEPEKPKPVPQEEMKELLMDLLTQSMGENVSISLTGSVYTICLWQDGLALTSVLAVAGDPEAITVWEDLRGTTAQLSISLCEFLAMNGHDDKIVTISLMNDVNMDNTLMEATLGVVTYDCTK